MGGGTLRPTLASIQANIFTPICTDCHIAGGPGPIPLDTKENSFNSLVNAPSIELLMQRVAPGDPENSYLVWKIQGRPTIVLSRMPPPPKPSLTQEEIDAIVTWIQRGAPR